MKLCLFPVLAAICLSLVACDDKKDGAGKPPASATAATTASGAAPAASAKHSDEGGW